MALIDDDELNELMDLLGNTRRMRELDDDINAAMRDMMEVRRRCHEHREAA